MAAARSILIAVLASMLVSCAGTQRPELQPGEAPPSDSAEAGLWMVMERAEERLKTSGRVIPDPELQAYVQELTCRLSGEHCASLRTYVVRRPYFNASMAPNGFISVWSGLLLRCENEDQLAAVLGHEIAHYLRRHSIQRWEAARDSLTAAQVFGVISAAAGVPLGSFAALGVIAHIQAYSRDQEREADKMGFEILERNGFAPEAAPKIWQNLIEEREAAEEDAPDPFFASHPPSEERMETLKKMADGSASRATAGSERFHELVARHRADWLEDEVDLGHFAKIGIVLERLKQNAGESAVVWYYLGEVIRRNSEIEDKSEAVSAFLKATTFDDAPPAVYRSLGLLLTREGDRQGALEAYHSYLEKAPGADDRQMIRFYMKELEEKP